MGPLPTDHGGQRRVPEGEVNKGKEGMEGVEAKE